MQTGAAKNEITSFVKDVGMLGYGMFHHTMQYVSTPLYARAFAFRSGSKLLVVAICELGFITISLKQGVLKYLKRKYKFDEINETNLCLLAQHTHSGPGGFSHYGLYNMSIPGFVPEIYARLSEKIADCVFQAVNNLQNSSLAYGSSEFAQDEEVGFNRSIKAYNANKDVQVYDENNLHLAIDRKMYLLAFKNEQNKVFGSINWFGTHTTSLSNNLHGVHFDNKGYAAKTIEDESAEETIVAFAQGSAGDVSPKFVYNPKHEYQRGYYEGKFPDDDQSALYNGKLQAKKAQEIISGKLATIDTENLSSVLRYIDFSNIKPNVKYTQNPNAVTSPACMGMSFFEGARRDGPGAPKTVAFVGNILSRIIKIFELSTQVFRGKEEAEKIKRKYFAQGKKSIILECGEKKLLGTRKVKSVILPGAFDESIKTFKHFDRIGALGNKPWTPQVLPFQLIQLGSLILACFPFEITTVAAKRLKTSIFENFDQTLITDVIICPYANSYSGYITTFEEYQVQEYEGGHTVFGQWSLAALQSVFDELCNELLNADVEKKSTENLAPPHFDESELEKRLFYRRKSLDKKKKVHS